MLKTTPFFALFLSLCLLGSCTTTTQKSQSLTLFVGTYTENNTQGISAYQFDLKTGKASFLQTTPVENPSYLTLSADQRFLYAVSELDTHEAKVHAYRLGEKAGSLTLLNSRPVDGAYPCFINTEGQNVYIANYGGGSLTCYPLQKTGALGKAQTLLQFNPEDQSYTSHMHCARFSPDSTQLFVTDLGADRIYSFELKRQADKTLLIPSIPPYTEVEKGNGPRHLIFAPNGKQAYLMNELSGHVIAFHYKSRQLQAFQTIASDSVGGQGSADIHLSPDGRFLYASNRLKADGLSIFRVASDGHLTKIGYQPTGIHPRNFILSPDGEFLLVACRDNNHIEVYRRDLKTGFLTDTGERIQLHHPVCLQWVK